MAYDVFGLALHDGGPSRIARARSFGWPMTRVEEPTLRLNFNQKPHVT